MEYRSIADLDQAILSNLHKVPRGVNLIEGTPRSGLLAASILALHLNLPMTDLDGLIEGRLLTSGARLKTSRLPPSMSQMRVLVVDDSILTGRQMAEAKEKVRQAHLPYETFFGAIYAAPDAVELVDVYFQVIPQFRIFEWNIMHHGFLARSCVDIDGVLCCDPTDEENDDGPMYQAFLASARPLCIPTCNIGWLVTSRLEKYRKETEAWLAQHGVVYDKLIMTDLPSQAARTALGSHAKFKAEVYRQTGARLFIESSPRQAREIADRTCKPVYCIATRQMYCGSPGLRTRARRRLQRYRRNIKGAISRIRGLSDAA